jgi:hypothetical protein
MQTFRRFHRDPIEDRQEDVRNVQELLTWFLRFYEDFKGQHAYQPLWDLIVREQPDLLD